MSDSSGDSRDFHTALKRSGISFYYADDVPSCTCRIYLTLPWTASYPFLGYFPAVEGSRLDRIRVEVASDLDITSFNLLPAVATAIEELDRLTEQWKGVNYRERSLDTFKSLVEASETRLRDDPFTAQFVSPSGLIRNPSTDSGPDSCSGCVEFQGEHISHQLVFQIHRSKHLDESHWDPLGLRAGEMPGEGVVEPTEDQFRDAGIKVSEFLCSTHDEAEGDP